VSAVPRRAIVRTSCLDCPGRERSDWRCLGRLDLAALDAAKTHHVYRPGEVIFYQGNPCAGMHCIEAGTVALRKTDAAGRVVIARLVHPQETLGCRTFFAGGPYASSAVAVTEVRVCLIERAALERLLETSPQLVRRFLRRMAQDLRAAEEEKLEVATLSVRARLVRLLVALCDRYGVEGADGAFSFELPLARQEIAALLGVRPESVARAVHALTAEGLATFAGRTVRIPDIALVLGEGDERRAP
jgi:CRP/FNR family transcriptional regulator